MPYEYLYILLRKNIPNFKQFLESYKIIDKQISQTEVIRFHSLANNKIIIRYYQKTNEEDLMYFSQILFSPKYKIKILYKEKKAKLMNCFTDKIKTQKANPYINQEFFVQLLKVLNKKAFYCQQT